MDVLSAPRSAAAKLVDGALQVTVVGGFGSPGIRLRRRLFEWDELPRMDGRVVVITGATSGLGRAAALAMRGLGADLTIVGRDRMRTAEAAARITASAGDPGSPVAHHIADLSELADARRFVAEFTAAHDRLDVLVHNAGALSAEHRVTADGFEATYAAQVLGPHIITTGLLPLLSRGRNPRVITVSSGGMYTEKLVPHRMHMPADGYDGVKAYALAKRAQVVMTEQWARRHPAPVEFHSMHPGWADTPGVEDALPTFRRVTQPILRTPDEGADTIVWLAGVQPIPAENGSFWLDRRPRRTVYLPGTSATRTEHAALWDLVCRQSGADPDAT
jgi:NAD(P)-dependent dehydrogenase (short-subunit alcohol dehydrogenase family)